jgi:hypothetical protein
LLKFDDKTIIWGMKYLNLMKHKRGFPELISGIEAETGALLRIAHPVLVKARWDWNIKGNTPDEFCPKLDMVNPDPKDLDAAKINDVHPMEWLAQYALDNFQFFPAAVELRRIFQEKFPTADGQSAGPAPMKGGV